MLDRSAMIGRLAMPSDRLKNYRIELRPFLGGIGVAPPDKQAIDARSLGVFGGNLDYDELTDDTTIYLPVFEDGALLFIGDGHAAQGAGELTGDALETSLDVEITVDLIEAKGIGAPRAESCDFLMAMGTAGSLHEATRRATASLAEWLMSERNLSASDIALVMGTAVEYDIAELVSSEYNVVAKVRKDRIAASATQRLPQPCSSYAAVMGLFFQELNRDRRSPSSGFRQTTQQNNVRQQFPLLRGSARTHRLPPIWPATPRRLAFVRDPTAIDLAPRAAAGPLPRLYARQGAASAGA